MRLPQDCILHIESAKDGVHITAEWQGELVRCKDCRYLDREDNYCTDGGGLVIGVTENDYCSRGERR